MKPVHHVYANRTNIGDWLSAQGIQRLLAPRPVHELNCDAPFVEETIDQLSSAPPDELIVLGGGGLFMDYFNGFWERFLPLAQSRRFVLWGIGVCDREREDSRPDLDLVREIVGLARLCAVRDELSRTLVGGSREVGVIPCPTFCALEPSPRTGAHLLHVDSYDNVGPESYERTEALLLELTRAQGVDYRKTNNLIEKDDTADLARVIELYRGARVVVSSRLHGVIVSVALDRPVVAISGDGKVDAFMTAAGLTEWVIGAAEVDRLPALVARLADQPDRQEFARAARAANERFGARVAALAHGG
jgi:polysaccharide pyruvyl transferase WcaK-like protein